MKCGPGRNQGSSPLARGLHRLRRYAARHHRIIPARAGFTSGSMEAFGRGKDHPRSRGVYRTRSTASERLGGSSPLARGLLPVGRGPHPGLRIIPARAGFTASMRSPKRTAGDHPRSRGVYLGDHVPGRHPEGSSPLARGLPRPGGPVCPGSPGSSPLARGLPGPCEGLVVAGGIIPARAGFTHA